MFYHKCVARAFRYKKIKKDNRSMKLMMIILRSICSYCFAIGLKEVDAKTKRLTLHAPEKPKF